MEAAAAEVAEAASDKAAGRAAAVNARVAANPVAVVVNVKAAANLVAAANVKGVGLVSMHLAAMRRA